MHIGISSPLGVGGEGGEGEIKGDGGGTPLQVTLFWVTLTYWN